MKHEDKNLTDSLILDFARREAGTISVEFRIEKDSYDGFKIEKNDSVFVITGTNPESCLHAVYQLREDGKEGNFRSPFKIRGVNTCESLPSFSDTELKKLIDRMGKWKFNTLIVHINYGWKKHKKLILEECRKRGIKLVFYVYTFISFLPENCPSEFMAKDGSGNPFSLRPENTSRLCAENQDAISLYRHGAEKFFSEYDLRDAFSVLAMTGDGYGHCRCNNCSGQGPVEQWQTFLKEFVAAGRKFSEKLLETIVYVQRYKPPRNMGIHDRLDRIMFDLHQRNIWTPLGKNHPVLHTTRETEVDPRASNCPENIYLFDRLKEWRKAFEGNIYIFENLNRNGSMSCPQPNTKAMLEDMITLRETRIDGVVYELLSGYGESFGTQMDILARGLWNPEKEFKSYEMSPVEKWCRENNPQNSLFFLESQGFPWEKFKDEWNEPVAEHMKNLREFNSNKTLANARKAIEYVYSRNPEEFNRQSIAFKLLKQLRTERCFAGFKDSLDRELLEFVRIEKLWDYQEKYADEPDRTDFVIEKIIGKI